jgi:pyruvate/2-oxoglutarate dehydrogenase complex dihydrolipoamide dehydrogenase (E3) component
MPNKAAAGRPEEIERCTGCNQACIGHYHAGMPINCTMNPWTGRERTLRRPVRSQRRLVIVGGGPAGCAAVRAAPGAHVTLFERSADGLGGQWRHALAGPSHEPIARMTVESLERWARGADVRLGVEATVEAVVAEAPDLVVLASGATPHRPELEAGEGAPRVLDAWDVLRGVAAGDSAAAGAAVDGPVVVWEWGGDWTGFITAEALATGGHAVRLASASAAFGEGMHQYQRNLYLGRLHDLGVELVQHVEPVALGGGAVECRNVFSDRPVTLPGVGTLVLAAGREPRSELYEPLLGAGLTVERAGDCLGARTAEEAVHEGTVAALAPVPVE